MTWFNQQQPGHLMRISLKSLKNLILVVQGNHLAEATVTVRDLIRVKNYAKTDALPRRVGIKNNHIILDVLYKI